MYSNVCLCRTWASKGVTRATLSGLAANRMVDVHVFWADPIGTQRLYRLEVISMGAAEISRLLCERGMRRWIYDPKLGQITLVTRQDEEVSFGLFLADLDGLAGKSYRCESWTVQEERLNPLAYELYFFDGERPEEGEEGTVDAWGFLVARTPNRHREVLAARKVLLEGIDLLCRLWEIKTGRTMELESRIAQHRMLLSLGCPEVVTKLPEASHLDSGWIFKNDGEPDLLLSLYLQDQCDAPPRRLLHAALSFSC